MSTKIWEAYVVKPGYDVWTVMWDIRRRAEKRVRATLTKLYGALLEDAKRAPGARELLTGALAVIEDGLKFNYLDASRYVQDQYKQTIGRSERSIWDLSVAVVVRRASKRRFLLIPYPGSGLLNGSLGFMRRYKPLADFHYQNSSDRPSHISAAAWEGRARTWEPLLEDNRWQDKLVLDIVSVEGFFRIDPAWTLIRKEVAAREKAGLSTEEAVEQVLPSPA